MRNERAAAVMRRLEEEDRRDRVDGTPTERRLRSVTAEVGQFLSVLVKIARARHILEIGTSGGYSTLWLAAAARQTRGDVTTLEMDPAKVERARLNLTEAGLDDLVNVIQGDARQTLSKLDGAFDFAFLDAEKELYLELLQPLVKLLPAGGVLVADNLLSHAEALAGFREAVESHPELECVLVPIPRGELLCWKRGA